MTGSSRNKLLLSVIAILLLANVALVYFVIKGNKRKPEKSERQGMAEHLKTKVGFSEEQLKEYRTRRDTHMKEMHTLFEDLRSAKENFFNTLSTNNGKDSAYIVHANEIAEKQKRIDQTTYQYFAGIRKLCTPGQLPKYDSLYQQVIKRIINGRRPQPSKHRDSSTKE